MAILEILDVKHYLFDISLNADLVNPAYEFSLIYEEVSGIPSAQVRLKAPDLNPFQQAHFDQIMQRRMAGEPLHRIFGWREFWGLRFRLSPATLEPRPDSETLIEAVLKHLPDQHQPLRVLDLGTGTGCLLLSVLKEYPSAKGIGIDISPLAISTAASNAKALGLSTRAQFHLGDWEQPDWVATISALPLPPACAGASLYMRERKVFLSEYHELRKTGEGSTPIFKTTPHPSRCARHPLPQGEREKFNLVISNPPYIETHAVLPDDVRNHDPHRALFAGADGLSAYRHILAGLPQLLAPQGLAVIELGAGQAAAVQAIAASHGLTILDIRRDLAGHERCLVLQHAVN